MACSTWPPRPNFSNAGHRTTTRRASCSLRRAYRSTSLPGCWARSSRKCARQAHSGAAFRCRGKRRIRGAMPGPLASKTAFITAAGQGIGRATALAFAAAGARVIATDIDAAKLQAIASDTIRTARLDVLRGDDIKQAARDAGAIDILFNCAGIVHQGTLQDAKEDDWALAFDLNVRSMFRTMQASVPGLVAGRSGVILNMASVASSLKGVPSRFIYSATKAAVIGITKSVATDYIKHGIRCNCLCPGTVLTPSLEERIEANAAQAGSGHAADPALLHR